MFVTGWFYILLKAKIQTTRYSFKLKMGKKTKINANSDAKRLLYLNRLIRWMKHYILKFITNKQSQI